MVPEEYFELRFGPSWKYISMSREFIQNFISASLEDKVIGEKVSMAVTELLENAVKYSAGCGTAHVILKINDGHTITAKVHNMTQPEHIKRVHEIFDRINTGDALKNYIREMKAVAANSDTTSHLGLARIRYEAGAELKLETTDNGDVTIYCKIDTKGVPHDRLDD